MNLTERISSLSLEAHELLTSKTCHRVWAHKAVELLDKYFSDYFIDPVEFIEKNINRELVSHATFPSLGFSHHPMTLHACEQFNIDLYFWLPSDTLAHDHGFHGAFMPLYGDYAQRVYQFKEELDLGEGVYRGELVAGELILLENHRAQAIYHAPEFIHEVVHESFCVTIVLRSRNSAEVLSDYYSKLRVKNLQTESLKAAEDWQRLLLLEHLAPERLASHISQASSGRLVRWLLGSDNASRVKRLILQETSCRPELLNLSLESL